MSVQDGAGERWHDGLEDRWEDVLPIPPLPPERDVVDNVELVDLSDGAAIQANLPGQFVWCHDDEFVVDLVDVC